MSSRRDDKPEQIRVVSTRGGYAVFVSPQAKPVAVFSTGWELLDWLAERVAGWEARRRDDGAGRTVAQDDGETPGGEGDGEGATRAGG